MEERPSQSKTNNSKGSKTKKGITTEIESEESCQNPDEWLQKEAPKLFEETLKQLGIDNSKIQGKHLISYSLDQLQSERNRVKK